MIRSVIVLRSWSSSSSSSSASFAINDHITYRLSSIAHPIPKTKRYEVTLGQTCSRFPSGPVADDDQTLDLPFFDEGNDDDDQGQGNDECQQHDKGHHANDNEGRDENENDDGHGQEVRDDQGHGNDGHRPDLNPGFDDDQDQDLLRGPGSHGESVRERTVDIESMLI